MAVTFMVDSVGTSLGTNRRPSVPTLNPSGSFPCPLRCSWYASSEGNSREAVSREGETPAIVAAPTSPAVLDLVEGI